MTNIDLKTKLEQVVIGAMPPRYKNLKPDYSTLKKLYARGGVILTGGVGTGKTRILLETMVAYFIESTLPDLEKWGGEPVAPKKEKVINTFLTVADVLRRIKDEFDRPPNGSTILERMINAPILFLDDLGVEKTSEWVKEQLYIVVNERYNWERPIMMTSNLSKKEIAECYGDRFTSRLVEMCEFIKIDGMDRRLENTRSQINLTQDI